MQQAAKGHADGGKTINLHKFRHYAGRTYGRSSLVGPAIALIKADTNKAGMALPAKRKVAIQVMSNELGKDVEQMKTKVGNASNDNTVFKDIKESGLEDKDKPPLIDAIRKQVIAGEDRIFKQDLESYAKEA